MQRTDLSCFFFRVSLESRDPLDLLVSVDPPDLLDPLDCPVLPERLVVRYEASICCITHSESSHKFSIQWLMMHRMASLACS